MRDEFGRWQLRAREMRGRADRVANAIIERARRTARAAGLDPRMPFLHAHNAVLSAAHGVPWRNVDYLLAEEVLRLERHSWTPARIADRWYSRNPPP